MKKLFNKIIARYKIEKSLLLATFEPLTSKQALEIIKKNSLQK